MKEIIPLQINAFGYDIPRNSSIEDALGYANDHDKEKEAIVNFNVRHSWIY